MRTVLRRDAVPCADLAETGAVDEQPDIGAALCQKRFKAPDGLDIRQIRTEGNEGGRGARGPFDPLFRMAGNEKDLLIGRILTKQIHKRAAQSAGRPRDDCHAHDLTPPCVQTG